MSLKRKLNNTHRDWQHTWEHITDIISAKYIEELTQKTLKVMQKGLEGYTLPAYAWSGGKDSLVIQGLCEKLGIKRGVFVRTNLEFSEFIKYTQEYLPEGIVTINTGQDLEFLVDNPSMLFPEDSNVMAKWSALRCIDHSGLSYRSN